MDKFTFAFFFFFFFFLIIIIIKATLKTEIEGVPSDIMTNAGLWP